MSRGLAWVLVIAAGLLEILFAVGLKQSNGLERPWIALGTGAALIGSLALLSMGLRQLPVGTAYAVWTGIGASGTALIGIALLGDPVSAARLASIAAIVGGVVGLRLAQ
ncbi:multidrug efflux SMR transporter [Variovorax sp. J2P1-59]|uniref:DMT family transporter n=1 Tax=Variovorax flavidus TaxID=3053501 RepID=UPI00257671FB|nr:multidrug efflux SMR transporter [Variovorax sp. J2P1-59]MDM0075448.1 multidrug efflux SMR transporter [Variovorax sp. J2P1-59]